MTTTVFSGALAGQLLVALHQAAEEALNGMTGQQVTINAEAQQPISPDGLVHSGKDTTIELQFEYPRDIHHTVSVFAPASGLAQLFELALDENGALSGESTLRLGDIVSACIDTLAGALTWVQPTPRAWLSNLEPIAADMNGDLQIMLPSPLAGESALYQIDMVAILESGVSCPFTVVVGEETEQALVALGSPTPAPTPATAAGIYTPVAPTAPPPMPSTVSPMSTPSGYRQPAVQPVQFQHLGAEQSSGRSNSIDLIRDVPLRVSVELGRTSLTVREVLGLGIGSVVELNRLAGEAVDVLVNDRLIARGEVVMVDESFGVRITDLVRQQPQ